MSRTDCDELKERLAEIVEAVPGPPEGAETPPEGALPATERARLLEHAAVCPECRELLRSYRALLEGMKALDRVRAPADLLDRVWKRIDAEGPGPAGGADGAPAERIAAVGPVRFRRLYLGLAATLLLGLGLGLYLRFTFPGKPVIEVAKSTASRTASSAEGVELARSDAVQSVQPVTDEERLTVAVVAPQKPGEAGGDQGISGALDLAGAFGSAEKSRLEDLMKEPQEEADKDSARRNGEEPQRFVVRLPQGSRERLDSLISLASAIAAPDSLGTSDLGDRQTLITCEVEAARLPDLEASLLGFQGAKRFSEQALAELKSDFVFQKELKAEGVAPAQKPQLSLAAAGASPPQPPRGGESALPAREGGGLSPSPSTGNGFRMRGSQPRDAAAPAQKAEKGLSSEARSAVSSPPPGGAAEPSPAAPSPGKVEVSSPSPAPDTRAAARRFQTPARPEEPRSTTSPVPPAAAPPPPPSSPSPVFSGDEIARSRAAKDSAPGAEREYFQASAAEGKQVPEVDRFGAVKKLKLGELLAPKENAGAPASARVRVEILVEME